MTPTPLRPYPATDMLGSRSAQVEPTPAITSSWHPVDLTSVLASPGRRAQATIGLRSDGLPLLYSGKVHSLAGETEAGKSWCALIWVAAELKKGRTCHYIDFEDDEDSVVNRLLLLGVPPATIQADFKYSRPTEQDPDAADLKPFADGQAGQSRLLVVKDRPGAVRSKAVNLRGKALIGLLNVSVEGGQTNLSLDPAEKATQANAWSPSNKMQQISELLEHDHTPDGLSYNQINQAVGGKAIYTRQAVDRLISDGYVATAAGPRGSTLHLSLKLYQAVSE